jgi:hypothetical protein
MENGNMTPQETKAAKAGAELMTEIFLLKMKDDTAGKAMFHSIEDTYYDLISDDFDLLQFMEHKLMDKPIADARALWCTLGDVLAKHAGINTKAWWRECSELAGKVERRMNNDEGK